MSDRRRIARVGVAIGTIGLLVAMPHAVHSQLRYDRGQNVQPAFDGYEINPDGSYTYWFAYLNRNYAEVVDIPIGPDNMFEPGPIDRGQPTRFYPRRHKSMFSVVVPADFGQLTWHLTVRGEKATAIAKPVLHNIIDRHVSTSVGGLGRFEGEPLNQAPTAAVEPTSLSVRPGDEASLTISGKDDGLPEMGGKSMGMNYQVTVYRGLGEPHITPASGRLENGRATVKVSFDAPGDYTLHVQVDDGSANFGTFCCWTNNLVQVSVK